MFQIGESLKFNPEYFCLLQEWNPGINYSDKLTCLRSVYEGNVQTGYRTTAITDKGIVLYEVSAAYFESIEPEAFHQQLEDLVK